MNNPYKCGLVVCEAVSDDKHGGAVTVGVGSHGDRYAVENGADARGALLCIYSGRVCILEVLIPVGEIDRFCASLQRAKKNRLAEETP